MTAKRFIYVFLVITTYLTIQVFHLSAERARLAKETWEVRDISHRSGMALGLEVCQRGGSYDDLDFINRNYRSNNMAVISESTRRTDGSEISGMP
jgi:hypothetical protein